ncbi:MAG: hypothetical protein AAGD11_18785 [Planctomycetota bacterium]
MHRSLRIAAIVLALVPICALDLASAQTRPAAVYARQRPAFRPTPRPPFSGSGLQNPAAVHAGWGYGGFGYQPFVAGSWYARPYPYHLDYFGVRSRAEPAAQPCPCEQAASAVE